MKSFKTLLSVTITVLLLLSTFAYAEEIRPYADPEFQQVFITLYSDGAADFGPRQGMFAKRTPEKWN